ncbi:MFS transporter [Paenibacillus sp. WLX1005]|uniref:MFS transporter n=1 Tax=Paenibacillus sp. WLX1005 TaxID=3243766 RepID=UPI003984048C
MKSNLLRNRIFISVYLSNFISSVGDRLVLFILPLWVMELTHSSLKVSIVNAVMTITVVLLTPFTGTIADRISRRKIMISADILRMIVMICLAILSIIFELHLGILIILIVIRSFGTSIFSPASNAALLTFVDKKDIDEAVAWRQTMNQLVGIIAPLLGGILVAAVSYQIIFIIDAASFLISVIVLLIIRFPNDIKITKRKPFWVDLKEGFTTILNQNVLKTLLISAGIINILGAALIVTLQVYVIRMHYSPIWWSIIFVSSPLGVIVGAFISRLIKLDKKMFTNAFIYVGLMGSLNVLMGLVQNAFIFTIVFFLSGIAFGISNIYFGSLYQKMIPLEKNKVDFLGF